MALIRHHAPALTATDDAALTDLYVRGTPANTLRAYERDLVYLTAWKEAAFAAPLAWPEGAAVALRFILDHAADLTGEALVAQGLRRSLQRGPRLGEAAIARPGVPPVLLAYDAEPRLPGISGRRRGRAVVDHEDLKIPERRRQHRVVLPTERAAL